MRDRIIDSPIICRDYETSGLNQFFDQPLTSCAKRYVGGEVVDELYYLLNVRVIDFHLQLLCLSMDYQVVRLRVAYL